MHWTPPPRPHFVFATLPRTHFWPWEHTESSFCSSLSNNSSPAHRALHAKNFESDGAPPIPPSRTCTDYSPEEKRLIHIGVKIKPQYFLSINWTLPKHEVSKPGGTKTTKVKLLIKQTRMLFWETVIKIIVLFILHWFSFRQSSHKPTYNYVPLTTTSSFQQQTHWLLFAEVLIYTALQIWTACKYWEWGEWNFWPQKHQKMTF